MLTDDQIKILQQILPKKDWELEDVIENYDKKNFPDWQTDKLCCLINEELMKKGLQSNWEPNDYGHKLEKLLDEVNRRRLK